MKIFAIIQASMSSQDLPGTVMATIHGKPVIEYLVECVKHAEKLDGLVVATTSKPEDKTIIDWCQSHDIMFFCGDAHHVMKNFYQITQEFELDAFVRLCCNSPVQDPELIDRAVTLYRKYTPDLVTNMHPPSFPYGQSVEVVNSEIFGDACFIAKTDEDLQQVTRYFYTHEQHYQIHNILADNDYSSIHLGIHDQNDFQHMEKLIEKMERQPWQYNIQELMALYQNAY